MEIVVVGIVVVMSIVGFAAMGIDKGRSKSGGRRIPERVLLGVAILGGSIGVLAGMYAFRHKTRHASFKIGVPAIFIVEAAVAVFTLVL